MILQRLAEYEIALKTRADLAGVTADQQAQTESGGKGAREIIWKQLKTMMESSNQTFTRQ